MSKTKQITARAEAKKVGVHQVALEVFAQYGFRRTTMNDIAQAAGISRPALYLMFENKEHLFHELAVYLLDLALERARTALASDGVFEERFTEALLVYLKTYYEPVITSPHGEELMDTNLSLAADVMMDGYGKLVNTLTKEVKEAEKQGAVSFADTSLKPKPFVELLLASVNGLKKKAKSAADFRKRSKQLVEIFLRAISR